MTFIISLSVWYREQFNFTYQTQWRRENLFRFQTEVGIHFMDIPFLLCINLNRIGIQILGVLGEVLGLFPALLSRLSWSRRCICAASCASWNMSQPVMRRHIIMITIILKQRPHLATLQYSRAASYHGWKEATELWIKNTRTIKYRFKVYKKNIWERNISVLLRWVLHRASSLICPRRLPVLAYRLQWR